MVYEHLGGRGSREVISKDVRAGEGVAVHQDHKVCILSCSQDVLQGRIHCKMKAFRKGVREHAYHLLAQFPLEVQGKCGDASYSVSVRVYMPGQGHLAGALKQFFQACNFPGSDTASHMLLVCIGKFTKDYCF